MESKFRNGAGKPVVALDIDGTLGDYHGHFLWFAQKYFGKVMPAPEAINPGLPLYRHMKVRKSDYRECKLAYRQGGMKRWMPAYEGASELTQVIREQGAEIWICTTRPYLRLENIDPDTREWLRRNDIKYDAVLFDDPSRPQSSKYKELFRQVSSNRVVAVVDDLLEQVKEAHRAGAEKVYLKDQPYNKNNLFLENFPVTFRVSGLWELQKCLVEDIKLWKAKQ